MLTAKCSGRTILFSRDRPKRTRDIWIRNCGIDNGNERSEDALAIARRVT